MPTGYTSKVQDGRITELKDYIFNCSTGFGAFAHMRDGSTQEIKHREVDNYYFEQISKNKSEYEEFLKLSDEEIQCKLNESYNNSLKEQQENLERFDTNKQRYLDMMDKVKNWNPPTDSHVCLKNFAIDQLEKSIDFDCNDSLRVYYLEEPKRISIEEYKQNRINTYLENIKRYTRLYEKEVETVEEVNKWIDGLVNSFK